MTRGRWASDIEFEKRKREGRRVWLATKVASRARREAEAKAVADAVDIGEGAGVNATLFMHNDSPKGEAEAEAEAAAAAPARASLVPRKPEAETKGEGSREWVLICWLDSEGCVTRHAHKQLWVFRRAGEKDYVRLGFGWQKRELAADDGSGVPILELVV